MFVCEDTSVFPEVSPLKDNLRLQFSRHSTSTASAEILIVSTMRCPSCRWRSRKDLVSRAPFECSDSGDTSSTRIMMHKIILKNYKQCLTKQQKNGSAPLISKIKLSKSQQKSTKFSPNPPASKHSHANPIGKAVRKICGAWKNGVPDGA